MRIHVKQGILAVLVAVCVFTMGFNVFRFRENSSKLRLAFWGTNLPYYNALQEVAEMYNERQDKYQVEVQRQDAGNYRIWMSSQLAGGTAPDILATTSVYANADAQNGYLYDFSEVLNEPNPYNADSEISWRDSFAGTYLSQLEDPNKKGRFTNIPTSTVSVRIVINEEMLESKRDALDANGINIDTDINEDWTFSQFRKVCEVFEADGKTAMQIANQQYINYHVSWLLDIFMAQVKYDEITEWDENDNGMIESEEICGMILGDDGMNFSSDSDFKEVLRFMKYWSKYWGDGFNSRSDTSEKFLRQEVPMMFCGSWGVAGIEMTLGNQNPDADQTNPYTMFEYKSLPFPRLTPQTYVDGQDGGTFTFSNLKEGLPLQEMGEPSGCFCIPLSTQKSGKTEGAVDFLRFFTSPEIAAYMADAAYEIPVMKGVEVNEIMSDFLPPDNSQTVRMRFGLQNLSSGTAEEFHFKRMQMYLATGRDAISLNALCSDVQKKYVEITSQLAEDNGWYL